MASNGERHRVSTGSSGGCKIGSSRKSTPKGGPSKYLTIKEKTNFSKLQQLLGEQDSKLLETAFEVDSKIVKYLKGITSGHSIFTHTEASDEYGKLYNRRRKFLKYDGFAHEKN